MKSWRVAYTSLLATLLCAVFLSCTFSEAIGAEEIGIDQLLAWLPADTEEVMCANGNYKMVSQQTSSIAAADLLACLLRKSLPYLNSREKTSQLGADATLVHIVKATKAVIRQFPSTPTSPDWDRLTIFVFKEPLRKEIETFLRRAAASPITTGQLAIWKIIDKGPSARALPWFLVIVDDRTLIVSRAPEPSFLMTCLTRIQRKQDHCPLPETLPTWKYVIKNSAFWAMGNYYPSKFKSPDHSARHMEPVCTAAQLTGKTIRFSCIVPEANNLQLIRHRLNESMPWDHSELKVSKNSFGDVVIDYDTRNDPTHDTVFIFSTFQTLYIHDVIGL
jgi:hypothetical protein